MQIKIHSIRLRAIKQIYYNRLKVGFLLYSCWSPEKRIMGKKYRIQIKCVENDIKLEKTDLHKK